jgi:hypothetical protein
MVAKSEEVLLSDGTLVRHRVSGYLGRIDGVTAIQGCFTNRGAPMSIAAGKENFQYRVIVQGQKIRRIAPVRDLEILETGTSIDVTCFGCQVDFSSSPSVIDKPGGICECGGWICPSCLVCQLPQENSLVEPAAICANQRKRLLKKAPHQKRAKREQSAMTKIAEPPTQRFRN